MLSYFTIFLITLGFNLIPFLGPSSIAYAGITAADFQSMNYFLLGIDIALATSISKLILLLASSRLYRLLSEDRKRKIQSYANKLGNGGSVLVFLASTIIPDDPVIFSLGLLKYNPYKFFIVFFFGRSLITVSSAYLGHFLGHGLLSVLSPWELAALSAVVLVIIIIIFLRQTAKPLKTSS
jgi:uncharacterized membrane protein YdjX (TVP38/TMEM64 family)